MQQQQMETAAHISDLLVYFVSPDVISIGEFTSNSLQWKVWHSFTDDPILMTMKCIQLSMRVRNHVAI